MNCLNRKILINENVKHKYRDIRCCNLEYFIKQFNISNYELKKKLNVDWYIVSCYQCRNCLINRRYFIYLRLQKELEKWNYAVFITLTYDQQHNPYFLNKKHAQNFIKYLKKELDKPIAYIIVGEYGEISARPHYHLILFINDIVDLHLKYLYTQNGNKYYSSPLIAKCWLNRGFNICSFDNGFTSNYILKYTVKSEQKLKQNLFRTNLKKYKSNLDRLPDSFNKYLLIDNFVQKHKKYFDYPNEFYLYSQRLGYISNFENKNELKKAPKYQLKKMYLKIWENYYRENKEKEFYNTAINEYVKSIDRLFLNQQKFKRTSRLVAALKSKLKL